MKKKQLEHKKTAPHHQNTKAAMLLRSGHVETPPQPSGSATWSSPPNSPSNSDLDNKEETIDDYV